MSMVQEAKIRDLEKRVAKLEADVAALRKPAETLAAAPKRETLSRAGNKPASYT